MSACTRTYLIFFILDILLNIVCLERNVAEVERQKINIVFDMYFIFLLWLIHIRLNHSHILFVLPNLSQRIIFIRSKLHIVFFFFEDIVQLNLNLWSWFLTCHLNNEQIFISFTYTYFTCFSLKRFSRHVRCVLMKLYTKFLSCKMIRLFYDFT